MDEGRQIRIKLWAGIGVVALMCVTTWFTLRGWFSGGPYDDFAGCVAGSGARLYTVKWCEACRDQVAAFGSSARLLTTVDCSTITGTVSESCRRDGIEEFPTWEFTYGSPVTGNLSFDEISQRTGCQIAAH